MTWLITGGSGQLGTAVSVLLSESGIPYEAWGSKDLDITQGPMVRDLVSQLSPKVIINCAAWTDVDGAEDNELLASRVNSDGAENIAIAAKKCGAKLVHISTDYVFAANSKTPLRINDQINPQSAYGRTKALGENRLLTAYPENSFIVRTAWLYSKWGKNFVKSITKLALEMEDVVRVVNDQFGQPTFAEDLAKQIVNLVSSNSPVGIYHGTNSGQASWFELAQEIFKLAQADISRVIPVSSSEYKRPAKRPAYSVLDHDAWGNTTLAIMRDWRFAIAEAMPGIISTVNSEG